MVVAQDAILGLLEGLLESGNDALSIFRRVVEVIQALVCLRGQQRAE